MGRVGWVLLALVLSLAIYYVLETVYFMVGDLVAGAAAFENSGAPDWRAILLPVSAFIGFRLLWSRIKDRKAA